MSKQEITLPGLTLPTPPEHQRPTPKHVGHREFPVVSSSWSPLPLVLGIMSLSLMMLITARIYSTQLTDVIREQKKLSEKVKNLTQQLRSCQAQKTRFLDTGEEQLSQRGKCPSRWSHTKERSYLFSPENRVWEQCKSFCITQSARLITIESKEEQRFIIRESFLYSEMRHGLPYYYPFWIGLSRNPETQKWVWVNSTALSTGLFSLPDSNNLAHQGGACVYYQAGAPKTGSCGEGRFCICEKKKDPEGKVHQD
ncbi:PREDICTED: C-type lectin domain family 1 member A-like [Crocodylus porosus]|uniref:C-type lectin domain family 1 member A-like n=1 Tax=Crocodylus porosus TaxID=8502 RepID=UPI000939B7DE|nr:PREDICTED: C-type lectin domain family 1 member A-like [Crocodylus porosus]